MVTVEALRTIIGGGLTLIPTGPMVHLYANDIALSQIMVASDFQEPTYTGYAAAARAVVGATFDDASYNAIIRFAEFVIHPTAAGTGQTIYGWYLTGPVGSPSEGKLLAANRFANPVTVVDQYDNYVCDPFIAINQWQGTINFNV